MEKIKNKKTYEITKLSISTGNEQDQSNVEEKLLIVVH